LRALGLTTLGQLAALEADEVEARFGPQGLAAHHLARGIDTRGPSTPRDDALPVVACDLGSPVATAEPLLFVLKGALASLGAGLRTKGLAAREVVITLALDDGTAAEKAVRPARPTSHEGALFDHCRAAFETWTLLEPVVALTVRAAVTIGASGEQGDLLVPRWADPAALEAAFDRIRGSEGADAVATPVVRDGHLPRDAGGWEETRRTDAKTHRRTGASDPGTQERRACALRLLPEPAPVRVRLGRAGIEAFHHGGAWHDVTAWSGPERLAPQWWLAGDGPQDRYTARVTDGSLWLLFRTTDTRQWFVEGWWD
jgi:protein ImuB